MATAQAPGTDSSPLHGLGTGKARLGNPPRMVSRRGQRGPRGPREGFRPDPGHPLLPPQLGGILATRNRRCRPPSASRDRCHPGRRSRALAQSCTRDRRRRRRAFGERHRGRYTSSSIGCRAAARKYLSRRHVPGELSRHHGPSTTGGVRDWWLERRRCQLLRRRRTREACRLVARGVGRSTSRPRWPRRAPRSSSRQVA